MAEHSRSASVAQADTANDEEIRSLLRRGNRVEERTPIPVGLTALPNARHPRMLVPLRSRSAARAALREHSDGTPRGHRVAAMLMAAAAGMGWGRNNASQGSPDDAYHLETLRQVLADNLGWEDLAFAVRIGPPRPNRKPVVKIMRVDGTLLGYAKVGITGLARDLVAGEALALRTLARTDLRGAFAVPRLLHHERRDEMVLTVVSPGPRTDWGLFARTPGFPREATRALVASGPIAIGPLATSSWWVGAHARLDAVADGPIRASLVDSMRRLERTFGGLDVPIGRSHGDWTPANMLHGPDGLFVWDWERFETERPIGSDAFHYGFKWASSSRSVDLENGLRRTSEALRHLEIDPALDAIVSASAMIDMSLRFLEAKQFGIDVVDTRYWRALRQLVEQVDA